MFLITQVQLMHRVAVLQRKLHIVIMGGLQDKDMRAKYRKSRASVIEDYNDVY